LQAYTAEGCMHSAELGLNACLCNTVSMNRTGTARSDMPQTQPQLCLPMLCCGASAAGSERYLIELQGLHLLRPQVCHLLIQLPCVLCCFRQSLHNNTFLHGRLNSFSSARVPARTLWHHRAPGQQLKAQFQRQQQSCCPCFSDAVRKLWRKKGYNPKQAQHSTAHMAHPISTHLQL